MNIEGGRGQWQISDPAAGAEDKDWAAQCVTRVSALVLKKLRHRPMTNRDLTGSIASRDRRWLKAALHALSGSGQIEWMEWQEPDHKLAASTLAALRERCAITTVEQLDALPVYSVLRCDYTSQAGRKLHELWERLEGGWFCIGAPLKPPYQDFGMPLFPSLLIWHPGWAAAEADQ